MEYAARRIHALVPLGIPDPTALLSAPQHAQMAENAYVTTYVTASGDGPVVPVQELFANNLAKTEDGAQDQITASVRTDTVEDFARYRIARPLVVTVVDALAWISAYALPTGEDCAVRSVKHRCHATHAAKTVGDVSKGMCARVLPSTLDLVVSKFAMPNACRHVEMAVPAWRKVKGQGAHARRELKDPDARRSCARA